MDRFDSNVETKQVWVAPELKKIDVEQFTANGKAAGTDGHGANTSS
jgi:hypothetical protein